MTYVQAGLALKTKPRELSAGVIYGWRKEEPMRHDGCIFTVTML
jgi:hypothetical protein